MPWETAAKSPREASSLSGLSDYLSHRKRRFFLNRTQRVSLKDSGLDGGMADAQTQLSALPTQHTFFQVLL